MVKEYLLDESRKKRIGLEEAIFCENKTLVQIVDIIKALNKNKTTLFTKLLIVMYTHVGHCGHVVI